MKEFFIIIVVVMFGCNDKKDIFNVLHPEVMSPKELNKIGAELIDFSHNVYSIKKGDTTVMYQFTDDNDTYPYYQKWMIKMNDHSLESFLHSFRFYILNNNCLSEETSFNNSLFYILYSNNQFFICYTERDEENEMHLTILYWFPIDKNRKRKGPYDHYTLEEVDQ
jgi:hypothetical protein